MLIFLFSNNITCWWWNFCCW